MGRSRGVATTLARLALVPLFALVACAQPPAAAPPPAASAPAASGAAAPAAPAAGSAPAAPGAPVASAPAAQPASQAAPAPLSPPLTVKVGTLTLVGEAGIFDAIAKGYFREEGIEVDLIPFRTTIEQTAPLATGELSLGSFAPDPSLFNAVERGIDLKIVGYNAIISNRDTSGGWVVRQDLVDSGQYKEPKDLKGHTIPIASPGGIGMVWTERMLAKGGLIVDDIRLTNLTFPDMPAAFANKGIDSAFVVEPFVTVAEAQRAATNIMPSNQLYAGLVAMVLGMSPVFAREQPEAAKRFVTAYVRGQRDYWRVIMKGDGDKEELYQILSQFTPIHETRLFERMATHDVDPNGDMDPRTPNELQDYFVKYGTQPQKVDLAKVIDRSYADYAIQRIGRVQP